MDELIRKLEEQRAALAVRRLELLNLAGARETLTNTPEELAEDTQAETRLGEIDGQLTRMRAQRDAEVRAAAARAGDPPAPVSGAANDPVTVTSEPTVYGQYSGHSYFLDLCRTTLSRGAGDGGLQAAAERQARHQVELRTDLTAREARRAREADRQLEQRLSGAHLDDGTPRGRRMARAELRALERASAHGVPVFEKRMISRTDGQGGYTVPPLWLIDEYIPYLRAGRTFADLWHNFPLPSGTDSINIPRFVRGGATGTQPGDGAPVPGRDMQDNFVNARVMTIAGQEDAAMQLLDQSPLNYDEILFMDLSADYNQQASAQLMLGLGYPQLNGMYPAGQLWGNGTLGTAGATNAGYYTIANALTSNQWIGNPGGGVFSLYTAAGQLKSRISRTRFLPPTAWVANPALWEALSVTTDGNNRPLVVPDQNGPYNALAISGSDMPEGLAGKMLSLPFHVDPNIPLSFGGTGATQPYMGAISNGHSAPVDGSGGTSANANVYTPLIGARWDDMFFWEGQLQSRVLTEVLSGQLAVRFQVWAYAASMPNRYQDDSGNLISYGNVNSIGALGAALSQGASGGLVGF